MNILITGAAGFLGRHFVDALIREDQHDLWLVDKVRHPHLPHDVMDIVDWLESDGGPDYFDRVYHFASPVGGRVKIEGDPMYNADALRIDTALFRWACRQTVKPLIIYPSSSAVYPVAYQQRIPQYEQLSERHFDPNDAFWGRPDQIYGLAKLVGEALACSAVQYGVSTLCIRPFSGYGPGQDFGYPVPDIALRALETGGKMPLEVWGGDQVRDYVYVRDLVDVTQNLLNDWNLDTDRPQYRIANIASGIPTTTRQLAQTFLDILGYDVPIVGIDGKPMGVMYRVGEPGWTFSHLDEPLITLDEGLKYVLEDVRARVGL